MDPDPDWIRTQWCPRIRIKEGQKWLTKIGKKLINLIFWCARCSHLRAEGSFCSFYRGLGIGTGKLQVLIKKYINFSGLIFSIFGHQNPGFSSAFSLKCWIRIIWIRILLYKISLTKPKTYCETGKLTCHLFVFVWRVVSRTPCRRVADTSVWGSSGQPPRSV